jgi:CheY-like chemotaxis protein
MEPIPEPNAAFAPTDARMNLLIAEDHDAARTALSSLLEWKGFSVTTVADGKEALEILVSADAPSIALLDWEMPGMSGPEICRAVRSNSSGPYRYLIVITAREGEEDIAEAMAAGADDFVRKPFGMPEVIARIRNGQRTLRLERSLAARIAELERSIEESRQLKRLLPICAYCKSIRDDTDYWQEIEQYIHKHTGTDFSHGICPACMEKVLKEQFGDPTAADIAAAKALEQPPA